ncbi:hypothetical protein KR51_00022930 [Rubidibacter lacunae KORDI 51-2]|uniref:Uncharacterized protein n=1 Tax=Rubidibacter lacunae KORDI 51-2 TaxID=582515 RepID=U5DHE5_9CHRO|nr:hypothetical protein [Rubidibacter lacunae]ERN41036.1 hypothetical protein KR51_00022930 [Rubidibacter lacunae KORDI 51-2]
MSEENIVKVIGFDLGHGEFSLTEVSMQLGQEPQTIEINNKASQITAVGKNKDGKTIIGNSAIMQRDMQSFDICFKQNPLTSSESNKRSIHDFVKAVYKKLIEGRYVEDPSNTYFFVGCPSGWQAEAVRDYQMMMIEAMLKNVTIVRESRAALMHAKEIKKIRPSELTKSVLVIDIGSSTTDFTWVINENDNPIDYGKNLGASLIDKAIFERTLNAHAQRAELEVIFKQYPVYLRRCEFACRINKEVYFQNPDAYAYGDTDVTAAYEHVQRMYEFMPKVNGPIMEEILNESMQELGGKSWKSTFRDHLRAVKQELEYRQIEPSKILLTGGASRMDFITTICDNIFPDSPWIRDVEPEFAIARGLARWGRIDINTKSFSNEANQILDRDLSGIVEKHIETLLENQAKKIAAGAVNKGLKPLLIQWRDNEISTLEELESKVNQEIEDWLNGVEASDIITSELNNWLPIVSKEVEDRLSDLYEEYALSRAALGITKFQLNPKTEEISSSIFIKEAVIDIDTQTYTHGVGTGAALGGALGAIGGGGVVALITAEILAGPVGWAALGVGLLGAALGASANAKTVTQVTKQERRDLSEQDIDEEVKKQREHLSQELQKRFSVDSELKKQLLQKMSRVLEDAIKEKVDKARLLIASDDI